MCEGTGDLQNHERDSWPCPKCAGGGPAPGPDFVTIPRDLHDLYKEAAEEWAKSKICRISNGEGYFDFSCDQCGRVSRSTSRSDYEHAANCDAALILGLDREAKG